MAATKLSTINVDTDVRERFGAFVFNQFGKLRGELASEATKALEEYMEKHGKNGKSQR